jgi:hypothetical protein
MTLTADQPRQAMTLKTATLEGQMPETPMFGRYSLIFTPYHPKKKRDNTICLSPNRGPKVEKKQTGVMAKMLIKKMIKIVSMNPRKKTGYARAPMAKDETTKLAESHCAFCQRQFAI